MGPRELSAGANPPRQAISAYCDQSTTVSFVSPTAVSVYITEVHEFGYLAPCARSALSYGLK